MPDYENDIVFKPELSWEELCEYAKSRGYVTHEWCIASGNVRFDRTGDFCCWHNEGEFTPMGHNLSYEQMKNIIDNLRGE